MKDMEEKNTTMNELARMTANEFARVDKSIHVLDEKVSLLDEKVSLLDEKVDNGFAAIRQEMQENTRVILAAIQTVEYTKLRIRLDTLETRVDKMERTGRK